MVDLTGPSLTAEPLALLSLHSTRPEAQRPFGPGAVGFRIRIGLVSQWLANWGLD
jgi:hypothetical protein